MFAGFVVAVGGHELLVEEFALGTFGGAADEEHVPEGDEDGGEREQGAPGPVDEEPRALKLWGESGRAEDHHERADEEEDGADDAEGVLPAGEGKFVASGVHVLGTERQSGDKSPHSIKSSSKQPAVADRRYSGKPQRLLQPTSAQAKACGYRGN